MTWKYTKKGVQGHLTTHFEPFLILVSNSEDKTNKKDAFSLSKDEFEMLLR